MLSVPAAPMRPGCASRSPSKPEEGAGKAGCRPHPWPASNQKSWRQTPQDWPNIRPSLRDGFNGVLRALPGDRAFLPPSPAKRLADLASASGCQNHTTSPSASGSFVRVLTARCDPMRPSHPAPNVRDDREAPLLIERGTVRTILLIYGRRQDAFCKSECAGLRQIGTSGSFA